VVLSRRRLALCAVAAVLALVIGFGAAKVFGPGHTKSPTTSADAAGSTQAATSTPTTPAKAPSAAASTATPPAAAPAAAPAAGSQVLPTQLPTVSIRDAKVGFSLSYPRAWSRLSSGNPAVPLLLSSHDGASLQVQALQLPKPITGARLATLRDTTGLLLRSKPSAQIIAGPRLLASANLPGYLYIYSFVDPISHQRVAHSQISLFSGRRMYTLVFQTATVSELTRFALLFDKITASFRAI
jgi:hypothetical protein